jgi:hypothetical protein
MMKVTFCVNTAFGVLSVLFLLDWLNSSQRLPRLNRNLK